MKIVIRALFAVAVLAIAAPTVRAEDAPPAGDAKKDEKKDKKKDKKKDEKKDEKKGW
jgi:hypothetical protein